MSKIITRGNQFRLLKKRLHSIARNYSKDDREKTPETEAPLRPGVVRDKVQSIQEESYFHKEDLQQLKELKKKIFGKKEKKPQEENKNDNSET